MEGSVGAILKTEYANRQSGEVESLVSVGSAPTSVIPSSGGLPRFPDEATMERLGGVTIKVSWFHSPTALRATPSWKVAGYGLPGRFAKPCDDFVMWVRIPCLPLSVNRFVSRRR